MPSLSTLTGLRIGVSSCQEAHQALLVDHENKRFVIVVLRRSNRQLDSAINKVLQYVKRRLQKTNPWAWGSDDERSHKVVALEVAWPDLAGMDYRCPLHDDGRLMLEARTVVKRTFRTVEDVREYYGGSLTPYHASSYTKRPSVSTGPTPHKMSSDARPSGCPGGYASSSPGPYSRYLAPPHAGAAPDAPTSATFPDTLHNQHDMTQQQEGPWHVTTPFPAAPTAPRRPPHRHRSGYGHMAGGSQASWRALEAAAEATLADAPRTCTGALRATRPAGPSGTASADEGCGRTATRSWRKGLWGLARGSLSGAAAVGSSLGMAAGLGSRRRLNLAPLYEPPVASADVAGASAASASGVKVAVPPQIRRVQQEAATHRRSRSVGDLTQLQQQQQQQQQQLDSRSAPSDDSASPSDATSSVPSVALANSAASAAAAAATPAAATAATAERANPALCAHGPGHAAGLGACLGSNEGVSGAGTPFPRQAQWGSGDGSGCNGATHGLRFAGGRSCDMCRGTRAGCVRCSGLAGPGSSGALEAMGRLGGACEGSQGWRRLASGLEDGSTMSGRSSISVDPTGTLTSVQGLGRAEVRPAGRHGGSSSGPGSGAPQQRRGTGGGTASGGSGSGSRAVGKGRGKRAGRRAKLLGAGAPAAALPLDGSGCSSVPRASSWTAPAGRYRHCSIELKFRDPMLPQELRRFVKSDLRLLKMYESGLPPWAVMLPQYGLFYRPWMRRVTWLLFIAISIFSMACGFYDLYKNVPFLKQVVTSLAAQLYLPAAELFEWLERHTQIRMSILLTYLFSKSPLFTSLVTSLRELIKLSNRLLGPSAAAAQAVLHTIADGVALAAGAVVQVAAPAVAAVGAVLREGSELAAMVVGPPARCVWAVLVLLAQLVRLVAAVVGLAVMGPVQVAVQLAAVLGTAGSVAAAQLGALWDGLVWAGGWVVTLGRAAKQAAPAVKASAKAAAAAAQAAGGAGGGGSASSFLAWHWLGSEVVVAYNAVRQSLMQAFKSAQAVINFCCTVAQTTFQHRVSLLLQLRRFLTTQQRRGRLPAAVAASVPLPSFVSLPSFNPSMMSDVGVDGEDDLDTSASQEVGRGEDGAESLQGDEGEVVGPYRTLREGAGGARPFAGGGGGMLRRRTSSAMAQGGLGVFAAGSGGGGVAGVAGFQPLAAVEEAWEEAEAESPLPTVFWSGAAHGGGGSPFGTRLQPFHSEGSGMHRHSHDLGYGAARDREADSGGTRWGSAGRAMPPSRASRASRLSATGVAVADAPAVPRRLLQQRPQWQASRVTDDSAGVDCSERQLSNGVWPSGRGGVARGDIDRYAGPLPQPAGGAAAGAGLSVLPHVHGGELGTGAVVAMVGGVMRATVSASSPAAAAAGGIPLLPRAVSVPLMQRPVLVVPLPAGHGTVGGHSGDLRPDAGAGPDPVTSDDRALKDVARNQSWVGEGAAGGGRPGEGRGKGTDAARRRANAARDSVERAVAYQ